MDYTVLPLTFYLIVIEIHRCSSNVRSTNVGYAYRLLHDIYIIQINRFPAFMDDAHKVIAGGKLRGAPDEVEGLLVEAIRFIIDDHCHRPEAPPALIPQNESFPCKAEGGFAPNTIGGMDGTLVLVHRAQVLQRRPEPVICNVGIGVVVSSPGGEQLNMFWGGGGSSSRWGFGNQRAC